MEGGIAAVVGTFDGVHRGHKYLLEDLKVRASSLEMSTRVYTFPDTPLATLRPAIAPPLLTTLDEKRLLLEECAVDEVFVENFGRVAGMTARDYICMLSRHGVKLLLIGYDNRFGSDGLRTVEEFARAADGTGVVIEQAAELTLPDGSPINSSAIRKSLLDGNVALAGDMLGYCYPMTGIVGEGKQLGRTIGFPTANLVMPDRCNKLIPAPGVYACRARVDGMRVAAMVNVGHRPTVDVANSPISIEAHLVGVDLDLYGLGMTLEFVEWLRDERRFGSIELLREQLERDREKVSGLEGLKVRGLKV